MDLLSPMTPIELRRHLHTLPELSGFEKNTSAFIIKTLRQLGITKIHHGFSFFTTIAEIDGLEPGPTFLFRCELDALPIQEENSFAHRSTYAGISHKCGHDGHAATMVRFAQKLMQKRPQKGRVLLLFQSAEETGAGAKAALESRYLEQFEVDYAFAYHNIVGFPLGTVLAREGLFTPCVESGVFELTGQTSHAAEPQKGINPAKAIAEIICYFDSLTLLDKNADDYFIATPIHLEMGEKAYGTSAGSATIGYTFRTWKNDVFANKKQQIIQQVTAIAQEHHLVLNATWLESFAANTNHLDAYLAIKQAATLQNISFAELDKPFEFGEDFGLFTQQYKGAMFGIGSGENSPPLHSPTYDFPDELIEIGSSMFMQLVDLCLNRD
ncbi:MAG: amidohydrolase [Spirosomataceae bacterium]